MAHIAPKILRSLSINGLILMPLWYRVSFLGLLPFSYSAFLYTPPIHKMVKKISLLTSHIHIVQQMSAPRITVLVIGITKGKLWSICSYSKTSLKQLLSGFSLYSCLSGAAA